MVEANTLIHLTRRCGVQQTKCLFWASPTPLLLLPSVLKSEKGIVKRPFIMPVELPLKGVNLLRL